VFEGDFVVLPGVPSVAAPVMGLGNSCQALVVFEEHLMPR